MSEFDLIIRNGKIATASDTMSCDIGIKDGKIAALGTSLTGAEQEIDAQDKWVLPGGIDSHCHMEEPMPEHLEMADDFYTATRSAACGGTTTVIPFAKQIKGESLQAAVDEYHRRAQGKPVIDYAFHMIVTDPTAEVLEKELPVLIENGYTSFKIYMTYDDLKLDDYQTLNTLAVARREGAMVMIHAENDDCITWLTEQLEAAGHTAPKFHSDSRPMLVEREATHRAITLAELVDVPILIVHVSGREAIEQIQWARNHGIKMYAETCPHYLVLTEDDLVQPGFEGAKCVCSPPPRNKANQQVVWDGITSGVFQVFSSDHAPFSYNDENGKLAYGDKAPFKHIPNGIPGIETRMPVLFSEGVNKKRIDINKFVELTATNPAKLYGLYPRKGTIAVGSDADLAIWDADRDVIIRNEDLHHNVDYTPYEGIAVRGWPETVLSRGEVVAANGEFTAEKGRGEFLQCGRSDYASPKVH
ncbi:MAG: dihydropyrimidinase [Pseudomonadales bacterium]